MNELLQRIYAEGCENDAKAQSREEMMFNITPETGRFLELLVGECKPKRILEIGTSSGYSTIWLAMAAERIGATVDSVDINEAKTLLATRNISEAKFDSTVRLFTQCAGDFLSACAEDTYQFIFLDSDRSQYVKWWKDIERVLDFGTLVVDNAESHAEETEPFRTQWESHMTNGAGTYETAMLPIGKGQLIVRKRNNPAGARDK